MLLLLLIPPYLQWEASYSSKHYAMWNMFFVIIISSCFCPHVILFPFFAVFEIFSALFFSFSFSVFCSLLLFTSSFLLSDYLVLLCSFPLFLFLHFHWPYVVVLARSSRPCPLTARASTTLDTATKHRTIASRETCPSQAILLLH